jgi:hypothetical protein
VSSDADGWPTPPIFAGDDVGIANPEILLRRVPLVPNMLAPNDSGGRDLTTAAFKYDDDGVSVYRELLLTGSNVGVEALRARGDDHVFGGAAGAIRKGGVGAREDANPAWVTDPENPIHSAHALLLCPAAIDTRRKREKALRALVHGGVFFQRLP